MLQMSGEPFDPDANREKADRICREAKSGGADIALLPEMFNIAYPIPDKFRDPEHVARMKEHAEPVDGPFVSHFRGLAKELDMAIGVSYLESRNGKLRNSMSLVDRRGNVLGTYSKFHTCRFSNLEFDLEPGDGFYVWDLDTATGDVKVGCMICYDREFPESARILMLKGAEVVLVPNACGIEEHRTNQLRTRGFENQMVCAMANYGRPSQNGNSVICGHDGSIISQAGEEEQILFGDIDLEAVRELQRKGIWGISFRRPKDYGILTEEIVRPGYGAKTAEERAKESLPPVKSEPFEKDMAESRK